MSLANICCVLSARCGTFAHVFNFTEVACTSLFFYGSCHGFYSFSLYFEVWEKRGGLLFWELGPRFSSLKRLSFRLVPLSAVGEQDVCICIWTLLLTGLSVCPVPAAWLTWVYAAPSRWAVGMLQVFLLFRIIWLFWLFWFLWPSV